MLTDWTWLEFGWFFGSIEAFVALSLLMFATLVLSWRFSGRLLLTATVGFFVAIVGHVFRFFVLLRSDGLCGALSVSQMPEYLDCIEQLAGVGTALSGVGLLLAGASLLIFALRHPARSSPEARNKHAAI